MTVHWSKVNLLGYGDRLFWTKAARDPETECWIWWHVLADTGYGTFRWRPEPTRLAHRHAYQTAKGEIPAGYQIDHLCRDRACINPDHLEAVPPRVNNMRGLSTAAVNARKTHCKRGHSLEEFYVERRHGVARGRACKVCHKERRARRGMGV